jgi:glycosyltransferase involved in cell wall biosynthesis
MRIAIDGRVLNDSAGKAVYTRSVLLALKEFAEHRYVVYGYQPSKGEVWPQNWSFVDLASGWDRLRAFRHLEEDVLFSPSSYVTTILSRRPTLTTIHDLVVYKVKARLPLKTVIAERLLLDAALRRSSAITVQTESIRNDLLEFFPNVGSKIRVVKPGAAASVNRSQLPGTALQAEMLERLGIRLPYLLFVGTIEPRKNISRLVEAFEGIPKGLRPCHQLVLAGKLGWQDAVLAATIGGLPDDVIATGRVSDEELATLYENCAIVVYPSLYEGVGYPILEGFYWQKPVITSDTSSMAEIGRGKAELIDPTSVDSIRDAMVRLIADPKAAARLVAAGCAALKELSWSSTARSYLEILAEIEGSATSS